MNKSLAPLIVSFAAIILLTFMVINSRTARPELGQENPGMKNMLSLGERQRKPNRQGLRTTEAKRKSNLSPDMEKLAEKARKSLAAGNPEEAEDALKTILVFSPSDKTALALLGGVFFRSGRYPEAEEIFKRLASIEDFKNATTLNHMASAIAKRGRHKEAVELCMKAQQLDPNFAEAYLNASAIYAAGGENENASRQMLLAYKLIGHGILSYSLDPVFDKVRSTPEFQEMISRARKDWERKRQEEKEGGAPVNIH